MEEGEYSGTSMDRFQWNLGIYLYASNTDDVGTVELAEFSGVDLYRVDLDIDWQAGQRERSLHFSTIRSVMVTR